jgi:hypothetical protein
MTASEISQWENRIRTQGETKKEGPPPKRICRSSPKLRSKTRQGCDDAQTINQNAELVKPKISRVAFDNPAGAKYKTKGPVTKSVRPNKAVLQYINVWNASLFPKLREFKSAKDREAGKQTKIYQETIRFLQKLIKGTLYDGSEPEVRFSDDFQRGDLRVPLERFKYLITNLEKKAFNSDYLPRNKTFLIKTSLHHFLVGNGRYGVLASILLEHALTPAIPNTNARPKDPKLTEVFKELFLLKTNRTKETLTFTERNHLVGASNKYLEFFTHFKDAFEVFGYKDPIDFLDEYYWKAISNSWPGKKIRKISLGYLNSSALIDRVIVPYFLKIGMLKDYDFEGATKEYWR